MASDVAGTAPAWAPTKQLEETYSDIEKLDLVAHVGELEARGYTIVPPEKVAPPQVIDRMLDAVLRVAEQRTGVKPDLDGGETHHNIDPPRTRDHQQDVFHLLLFDDPIFEEALLNPTMCALVTYLLGEHAKLVSEASIIKGPSDVPVGSPPVGMHSDNASVPTPFSPYAHVCNATWTLSDYTREGGAIGFVPGSHKLLRHPISPDEGAEAAVAAEAPKGSLIFWHGNTWHCIFPRTAPGLRVTKIYAFGRQYMTTQQPFRQLVPKEAIERNPRRFATFMGLDDLYPLRFGPMDKPAIPMPPDEVIWGPEMADANPMRGLIGSSLYE